MSRIAIPTLDAAPASARHTLDNVARQVGFVPNLFRLSASSPAVLNAVTGLSRALSTVLDVGMRERIALAVAQVNGCDYCLAAHTHLGLKMAGMTPEEVALARNGASADPKTGAAVRFAAKVAATRGKVDDVDVAAVRIAGFDDAQVLEIVALVAQSFLTNLLNNVAGTEPDFPDHAAEVPSVAPRPASSGTGRETMAPIELDNPAGVAAPLGAYSHSAEIRAGSGLIFLSGQVPVDPNGRTPETLAAQADQVYANVVAVLAARGVRPDAIVKLVTYLVEDDVDGVVPGVRTAHLGGHRPASTIVHVRGLAVPGWKIEVEAVALGRSAA